MLFLKINLNVNLDNLGKDREFRLFLNALDVVALH